MAHAEQPSGTAPSNPDRRDFIAASIGLAAAAAAAGTAGAATVLQSAPNASKEKKMPFTLPELPYAENALEPVIDAKTMNIHRTKHHQAYVDNLNKAVDGTPWASMTIDEICRKVKEAPDAVKAAVRNNGGGHWNHSMFWKWMAPKGQGGAPSAELAAAIDAAFGSMDAFKEKFAAAGAGRFGSGWAWLCKMPDGKVAICSTPNQDNPLMKGISDCTGSPILGCDVWEHAYYLHYQNRRPDYLKAWWDVVNWNEVNKCFAAK
jgi:Fe-Mn family superoxide dismutase